MAEIKVLPTTIGRTLSVAYKKLEAINGIQSGKEIRQPIVDMLTYIDEFGPDASTFRGLTSDDLVKEDGSEKSLSYRINKIKLAWTKDYEAAEYKENEEGVRTPCNNPLMTQGIRKVIGKLDSSLWPSTES